jgi:uncharacterized membrane protein
MRLRCHTGPRVFPAMQKGRMEAFSDGVLAIIVTIMVLELKVPHGSSLEDLRPLAPVFFSYLMSFAFVGIYWNNHHHLFQASRHVTGGVLWANLHLLFWLSLVPFTTGWMGENHFDPTPVAVYGGNMIAAGFAYFVLTRTLLAAHPKDSVLVEAIGKDVKGRLSLVIYVTAVLCSLFVSSRVAIGLYLVVSILWMVPDRRIEKKMRPASL